MSEKSYYSTTTKTVPNKNVSESKSYFIPKKPITRSDTMELTQKFNKNLFNTVRKNIQISHFSIMKDDIKNYRTLTEIQIDELHNLTEEEKIDIIKIYDNMIATIEDLLD
jgi:L-asparaginase/Glu-tRNA(Gln) amidotransferase subunit D